MAGRLVYVLKPHVNAVTGVRCQAPMLFGLAESETEPT